MIDGLHFMTFGIGEDCFALPVPRVREVLEMQPYSRLPAAPDYVLGLVDLRGECLLVLDLRLKFGAAQQPATPRTRILVVETNVEGESVRLGLLVDGVFGVTRFEGGKPTPALAAGGRWNTDFVIGIGREAGRIYFALDLDRLLRDEPLPAQAA